jgi:hypothetical protein
MIGKLKAGESVLLEDGTIVKPEEVYAEDSKDHCPNALIVECGKLDKLESLVTNSNLQVSVKISGFNLLHFTAVHERKSANGLRCSLDR